MLLRRCCCRSTDESVDQSEIGILDQQFPSVVVLQLLVRGLGDIRGALPEELDELSQQQAAGLTEQNKRA